jgi:hypothetical protein
MSEGVSEGIDEVERAESPNRPSGEQERIVESARPSDVGEQVPATPTTKLGHFFNYNGLKYEFLGHNRAGMIRARLVRTATVFLFPISIASSESATASSGYRRTLIASSNERRTLSDWCKNAISAARRTPSKCAKLKPGKSTGRLRKKIDDLEKKLSLSENERIWAELEALIRSVPALKQMAIEYYSTPVEGEDAPTS